MPRYIGHSTANTDSRVTDVKVASTITGTATLYLPLVSDVNDDSSSPRTMAAVGGAAISSTQKKFGAGSLYLDGVDDYVTVSGTDWDFGSANFTIDGWFYCTDDSTAAWAHIFGGNGSGSGWNIAINPSTKAIQFYENGLSTGAAGSWTVNTWHHYATVRNGTNISTYLDGVVLDSDTISAGEEFNTDAGAGGAMEFGRQFGSASEAVHFTGYLQDWRILKGVVCYTGAFDVPVFPRGGDIHGSNVNGNDTTIYTIYDNKWNSGLWSIGGSGNSTVNTRRKTGKWTTASGLRHHPPGPATTEYLVIGGGGGGGAGNGAGAGGAGGYRSSWNGAISAPFAGGSELTGGGAAIETGFTAVSGTPYTITVGAGGQRSAAGAGTEGGVGGPSSIAGSGLSTITSLGGGGGGIGENNVSPGSAGGSGGGGGSGGPDTGQSGPAGGPGSGMSVGGAGTAGQGYVGGAGAHKSGNHQAGGGGGGSSAVGADAFYFPGGGGPGGAGTFSTISGSSVQRGGGGAGGIHNVPGDRGTPVGGAGGGGAGGVVSASAVDGTTNTGGGGGGAGNAVPGGSPPTGVGYGGSGVVILRMRTASYPGVQSGGTVTTSGFYTIITYNSSGTYTG